MDNNKREVLQVNIDDVIPNRFQPRLFFDEKAMNELAKSIKLYGIIQPLILRKVGDKYEIVAGERRYKAALLAGLKQIPAVLVETDDKESAEIAVVENIQRKDLNPLEEAKSYKKLLEKRNITQEELAERMGKKQTTISNKLRLLTLDDSVQQALLQGKISERHARSLLNLKNQQDQKDVLEKIINRRLTVKQTDELIKSVFSPILNENLGQERENYNGNEEVIETPFFEPKDNGQDQNLNDQVDVNKIKETAMDINFGKERPNINDLLQTESSGEDKDAIQQSKNEQNPVENLFIPDEPKDAIQQSKNEPPENPVENLFIPNEPKDAQSLEQIPKKDENLEDNSYSLPDKKEEVPNVDSLLNEFRRKQAEGAPINDERTRDVVDLRSALTIVRNTTDILEKKGFIVDVEEFDFEKMYQIIIKIKK